MEYGLRLECLMCSCVFAFSAKLSVTWASGYVLFVIVFYGLQVVLQRKAGQLIQGAHKVINIISNVFDGVDVVFWESFPIEFRTGIHKVFRQVLGMSQLVLSSGIIIILENRHTNC